MSEFNRGHRTYRGRRLALGKTQVTVKADPLSETAMLRHITKHSPDGFEWGYGGSGPADLALAILSDFFAPAFGPVEQKHLRRGGHPVLMLYQDFKWAFVAALPPEWEITGKEIADWIIDNDAILRTLTDAIIQWEKRKEWEHEQQSNQ